MSMFMQILKWTGPLAGIGAITLGLLHWFFRMSFLELHMLFGVLVTLALLTSGMVAIFTRKLRILGAMAMVFALIVPVFGVTQMQILVGNFHWLIQVAHLLVGAVAISLTERIGEQYLQIKQKLITARKRSKPLKEITLSSPTMGRFQFGIKPSDFFKRSHLIQVHPDAG
jgi:hypothetical protein